MSSPLPPTSDLVSQAWLRLAAPGVRVDFSLPPADPGLRTDGFIRIGGIAGNPNRYVPMREPVVLTECWMAPAEGSKKTPWHQAGHLANTIVLATYDPALMGVVVDLSSVGSYGSARVHTVTAVSEPQRIPDDPSHWARFDVDLELLWTAE